MAFYYRRIVKAIEAIQLKLDGSNIGEIQEFVPADLLDYSPKENRFFVKSQYGNFRIELGDYIVRDEDGQFYPYNPRYFEVVWKPFEAVFPPEKKVNR